MTFYTQNETSLKRNKHRWKMQSTIECLGVSIGVKSNNIPIFKKIKTNLNEILPLKHRLLERFETELEIKILRGESRKGEWTLYCNDELVGSSFDRDVIYDLFVSKLRSLVAEYTEEFAFLHAGAVAWKGRVIIIPGKSRAGKTTLIGELINRGCEYFSDEFAVLDNTGLVHPYPKMLSVRGIIDEHRQLDIPVEKFGGKKGSHPLPAGFILLTQYNEKVKRINLTKKSPGGGVMASLANSISIRKNPKLVLEVLSVMANQVIVLEGKRAEAGEFADYLLKYLEKNFED